MKFHVCAVLMILMTTETGAVYTGSQIEDRTSSLIEAERRFCCTSASVTGQPVLVDLDDDKENICNNGHITLRFSTNKMSVTMSGVFNIPVPEIVGFKSMGNLSTDRGNCSINFQLPSTNKCNAICVNVTRLQVASDQAKVILTPMLSMSQGMNCTTTRTLNLMVTQTPQYTSQVRSGNIGNRFQLDMVIQAVCSGNNGELVRQSNEDTYMSPEKTLDNLIHGVVTGVMLALGWLVIFAIFKFYYKYSAHGGKRYYTPPPEDQEATNEIQMINMQQTPNNGASASRT